LLVTSLQNMKYDKSAIRCYTAYVLFALPYISVNRFSNLPMKTLMDSRYCCFVCKVDWRLLISMLKLGSQWPIL